MFWVWGRGRAGAARVGREADALEQPQPALSLHVSQSGPWRHDLAPSILTLVLTLLPETSFQWPLGHQISVASVEKTVLGLGAPPTPNRMLLKIEVAPGLMLGNMGQLLPSPCRGSQGFRLQNGAGVGQEELCEPLTPDGGEYYGLQRVPASLAGPRLSFS